MERILIVSDGEQSRRQLAGLFTQAPLPTVAMAAGGGDARRMLLGAEYDLVLVNAPLRDEFGHELAVQAARGGAGVLMLVRAGLEEEAAERVEDYGVLVLPRPLNRTAFHQSVRLLQAARRRVEHLLEENRRLREKMEELRIVERAKYVLIEHLGLTEEQAHRCIEKQAMDRRATRRSVAEGILNTYEA
ncbi:ANTAR domain-containing protein [Anaerofilum sp. BX8]|uniref:Stage 0 sporulation protein A homolog n=1 Tax=Anaerofilum hominis TaxID=2763016 RepID=A0A923KX68_9FIRM|nr:ANTAR domain-containing protein [Anaerofilum hominis]MBC5580134.1 ANTAR domain-containing protein [Anaerofilum hominis]